jgi:hypothetical protein
MNNVTLCSSRGVVFIIGTLFSCVGCQNQPHAAAAQLGPTMAETLKPKRFLGFSNTDVPVYRGSDLQLVVDVVVPASQGGEATVPETRLGLKQANCPHRDLG